MEILSLCLIAAQILLAIGVLVPLWQIRGVMRREDLPQDDPLPAKEGKFVVVRMRLMCVFLAAGTVISLLTAVLRFIDTL